MEFVFKHDEQNLYDAVSVPAEDFEQLEIKLRNIIKTQKELGKTKPSYFVEEVCKNLSYRETVILAGKKLFEAAGGVNESVITPKIKGLSSLKEFFESMASDSLKKDSSKPVMDQIIDSFEKSRLSAEEEQNNLEKLKETIKKMMKGRRNEE